MTPSTKEQGNRRGGQRAILGEEKGQFFLHKQGKTVRPMTHGGHHAADSPSARNRLVSTVCETVR